MRESRKNLRRNGFVRPSTIARITCRKTYSQITCDGSQTDTMTGDWDNLRVFLALAEEGSLTAAARRLRVSHPTVERRIKALGDELGTRLFARARTRVEHGARGSVSEDRGGGRI